MLIENNIKLSDTVKIIVPVVVYVTFRKLYTENNVVICYNNPEIVSST